MEELQGAVIIAQAACPDVRFSFTSNTTMVFRFQSERGAELISAISVPPEEITYQNLAEKSHFFSLRDQLRFMFQPTLRSQYEDYIHRQASTTGYKTLFSKNLQQASDMTVANLYYYFKVRDEYDVEEAAVMA